MYRRLIADGFLALALLSIYTDAVAQTLPDEVSSLPWVIDGGFVEAEARVGSRLYLGGGFRSIARPSHVIGPFAALDGVTGDLLAADPALAGQQAHAVASDGEGGWFVGGGFVLAGQYATIIHLDRNGRRVPWATVASGQVYSLARSGGTLYVGGQFGAVGGQPRANLAAIDIATQAVLPWNPSVTGAGVHVVHAAGPDVFVGGSFSAVGGLSRTSLARIDAQTAVVSSWAPVLAGDSVTVRAITATAGVVYAGGQFSSVDGVARRNFVALGRTGGAVLPASPDPGVGPYDLVMALATQGTTIYIGGAFESVAGTPRASAAAVDAETGALLSWAPSTAPDSFVRTIALTSDGVVLGGDITTPSRRRHLVKVDAISGAVMPQWDPAPGWDVMAIATDGSRLGLAGFFSTYKALPARGLAGIDLDTGALLPVPPVVGRVRALAASPTTLFVGGFLYTVGGQPRSHLAAVDIASGATLPFAPNVQPGSHDGPVLALAVAGNTLYVGGSIVGIGLASRQGLAAVDASSGVVLPFQAPPFGGLSGAIIGVDVAAGRLWVSGPFTSVGGQPRASLAVLDATTGALDAIDPAPGSVVNVTVDGSAVYVSGSFTTIAGQPRAGLARLDATTGALDPWVPPNVQGTGALGASAGLVVSSVSVATPFAPRQPFYALDPASGAVLPWGATLVESASRAELYPDGLLLPDGAALSPRLLRRRSGGTLEAVQDFNIHIQGLFVTMRWTPSMRGVLPTSYRLVVGSGPGRSDLANLVIGPASTFTVPAPPGRYFVRLVPQADGVDGPPTPEVAFVSGATGCTTMPAAPRLSASAGPSPVLSWAPQPGFTPTGYEVRAGASAGSHGLVSFSLPAGALSYATTGAPPGTYYVVVAATNACGVSVVSNEVRVDVSAPSAPQAPTNLAARATGSTVMLDWAAPPAPLTGYVLEAGSAPGLSNLVSGLALGATPTYSASGVPRGRYYVRVRAANGALVSAPSNEIVVDVP